MNIEIEIDECHIVPNQGMIVLGTVQRGTLESGATLRIGDGDSALVVEDVRVLHQAGHRVKVFLPGALPNRVQVGVVVTMDTAES